MLPRKFGQRHTSGCLLRAKQSHHQRKGEDQKTDDTKSTLAISKASCRDNSKLDQSLHAANSPRVPNYLTTDILFIRPSLG